MKNKLYIGTISINEELYLTSSQYQKDLVTILLVSDAEHVQNDIIKLSKELKKPIYY